LYPLPALRPATQGGLAMLGSAQRRRLLSSLFLFVASVYVLTSSGTVTTIDVRTEIAVAHSLITAGNMGADVTQNTRRGVDGRSYSDHGVGASVLLIPAALANGGRTTYRGEFVAALVGVLFATLSVVVLAALLLDIGLDAATAVVGSLVFAFATLQWPYAHDVFDVVLAQFFGLLALFSLRRFLERGKRSDIVLSGCAAGAAVLVRYSSGILLLPLAGYIVSRSRDQGWNVVSRRLATWMLPAVGAVSILLALNWIRFGNPLQLGLPLPATAYQQSLPQAAVAALGLLVSPGKGVLLFCPVFLLAGFGFRDLLQRDRALAWTTAATVALTVAFYARLTFWHGDWAWGPRYLVPVLPLLALWVAPLFQRGAAGTSPLLRIALPALVAAGALISASAIAVSYAQVLAVISIDAGPPDATVADPGYYFTPRFSQLGHQAQGVRAVLLGPNPSVTVRVAPRVPAGFKAVGDSIRHGPLYSPDIWWVSGVVPDPPPRSIGVVVGLLLILSGIAGGQLARATFAFRPAPLPRPPSGAAS
jgi:hypothetical protein